MESFASYFIFTGTHKKRGLVIKLGNVVKRKARRAPIGIVGQIRVVAPGQEHKAADDDEGDPAAVRLSPGTPTVSFEEES